MKALIAEDTRDLNRVLTVALEHSGYDVDSALDGEEAAELIKNNGYDIMILDIMMPKKDGITLLQEIRADHITTPVLMLTAKAEIDDRVVGLDAGADDYLTKPFAMKELMARVRAMTRRRKEYEKEVEEFGDLVLNSSTCELKCENAIRLSVKEFDLLKLLVQNAGRELTVDYLLERLWSDQPDSSSDTLQLYIMYLQNKLRSVASSVKISGNRESGYCLVNEADR